MSIKIIIITFFIIFCVRSTYGQFESILERHYMYPELGAGYSCPSILGNETYFLQRCKLRLSDAFCNESWLNFSKAWNIPGKNLSLVTEEDYSDYIEAFTWAFNKTLIFWSGTGACPIDVVHNLTAQQNFTSLEDSSAAFIVTDSHWCIPDLYNATAGSCRDEWPQETVTTNGSSRAFWKAASREFAKKAYSNIYMLIRPLSVKDPAYRPSSTFAGVELPTLATHAQDILSYHIMVMTDYANIPNEICGKGSLVQLVNDVKSKLNLTDSQVTCVNDPPCVLRIMCYIDNFANSSECQGFSKYSNDFRCDVDTLNTGSNSPGNNHLVLITCLSVTGAILLVLVILAVIKRRTSKDGYQILKN